MQAARVRRPRSLSEMGITFGTAPLRLLHKTSSQSTVQGILQIYHNGTWGTICDDYWDMTDTNIACIQLGFMKAVGHKHLGQGIDPIWLDDVKCNGNESSLDQCKHRGWGLHNCGHIEDIGIICKPARAASLRLLRITSSPSSVQGILQIYYNRTWGTICAGSWGLTETIKPPMATQLED
ncbi:Scavenger receptor cysteine-rich type 1 protein M130 [Exaiptasia diaphana]|nr:Scavenger receptor cysteine-rich type 1 protein M130 [Exaiptasia diaphana]